MPYDLQGNFTRLHSWEADRQNNIEIMSDRHDEEDDNFSAALNQCLLRDGRAAMEGNLNVGNYQIKNVAQGSADNDAVNLSQANKIKEETIKECREFMTTVYSVGDIKPSLQQANHGDWLLCNGQAVSRTEYTELFSLIGVSFGGGDGVNTFNLPDYRGKFLRGLGGDSAADIYTTQQEGLPNITGSMDSVMFYSYPNVEASGSIISDRQGSACTSSSGETSRSNISIDASKSSKIYGASKHVTPINQAVNWFIKAKGDER